MKDLKLDIDTDLPLRDVVFQTLREAILKGDLKPGERLMELKLAEKLGVSRTPIREAIRMLEQEGLAVNVPRKGAKVAGISEKDMEDVLRIREALEILAVQLACGQITREQLELLEKNERELEEAAKLRDLKAIVDKDIAFHDVIYHASGNLRLVTLLNNLRGQIYRYRVEYLKDENNYPCLMKEHRQIIEGLQRGEKEKAGAVMQRHMDNQENSIKNIIRRKE